MVQQIVKWQTADGKMFDTFGDADRHEQQHIQISNMREYLRKHSIGVLNEREELLLEKISQYIISEFEPT